MLDINYQDQLYTIEESYELYCRTAYAVTETIFGEGEANSRNVGSAFDRLKKLAKSTKDIDLKRVFEDVITHIDKLIGKIQILRSGIHGERILRDTLELLPIPHDSIGPFGIDTGVFKKEIDQVVITRHCIFLLEAKNMKSKYVIDAHGLLYDKYRTSPYDITERLYRKRAALQRLLIEAYGEQALAIPIRTCLVFVNKYLSVTNLSPGISWFYPGELLRYIEQVTIALGNSAFLDIDALRETITLKKITMRFPLSVDIVAIYNGLCAIFPTMPKDCWRNVFTFTPSSES